MMTVALGGVRNAVDVVVTGGEAQRPRPWDGLAVDEPFRTSTDVRLSGPLRQFLEGPPSSTIVVEAPRELVVLDPSVPAPEALLADLRARTNVQVLVLRADRDGLNQITEALLGRTDLAALHVISHGVAGAVFLGDGVVDARTLSERAAEVASWAASLSEDADLLIYGCDVADGARGRAWVDELARLTGADVAASTDRTGQGALGGNWVLEHQVGTINASIAVGLAPRQTWGHVLAVAIDATSTGTSSGGSFSISHTTSGTDRLMLVGVSINLAGANSVATITYGGSPLNLVGTRASGDARIEIWSLTAPAVGTSNVVITMNGTSDGNTAGVMTFTGVHQGAPLGTFASGAGSGGSGSVTVGSAVGELVFGVIAVDDPMDYNLAPGPGQTERWDLLGGGDISGGGTTSAGAASVGLAWTWPGSDGWAAGGVSVRPAVNTAP
ncbi:MAG: DUF4347 domain-containing protein, partial [Isosphaeraceae bacterium]